MRTALLYLVALLPGFVAAVEPLPQPVVNYTAQQAAENNARREVSGHCTRVGGRYEGIGFSPVSADDAIRRSCFWGKRPVREIGVARGRRGWYAVVWYE